MPPNVQMAEEMSVPHEGRTGPEDGDVTVPQDPEVADQKVETEAELTPPQHSVFREQQHHIAEDQKILIHTEANTAASATTESEGHHLISSGFSLLSINYNSKFK